MTAAARPLHGLRVGLSVAGDPAALAERGFTTTGMNRFTVRLSRALLADGATLAFGHDWRPDGVMEAVASIAFDFKPTLADAATSPAILNLVPWPGERSETDPRLLARLNGIVEVRPSGLPPDLAATAAELERGTDPWRYCRARGLTQLRHALTAAADARIAFGGKLTGFDGRLPGIVEEVVLALQSHQPVYLAGLLGGAAAVLGQVLLEGAEPTPLWQDLRLEQLYQLQVGARPDFLADFELDRAALDRLLSSTTARERLLANGLSETDNRRLLHSSLEEEVIELAIKGLQRVAASRRPGSSS